MFTLTIIAVSISAASIVGYMASKKIKSSKKAKKLAKKAVNEIAKIPAKVINHQNNMIDEMQSTINSNLYLSNNQENTKAR